MTGGAPQNGPSCGISHSLSIVLICGEKGGTTREAGSGVNQGRKIQRYEHQGRGGRRKRSWRHVPGPACAGPVRAPRARKEPARR